MERVAVDIAGPLPTSSSGNRYIVVAMDYFTKWPEAYPVPNQEATTVARVLVDEFFCRFGIPYELHSDQGRNFESKVFQECCNLLGIRKTRTTPLHPESDGMVERFNRTLGQELAKRCRHSQENWDEHLPTILMSYRSAEHESTGYTPAQLVMGRDLRLPVDLMMPRPPEEEEQGTSTNFAMTLRDRLKEVHAHARSQLNITSQSMKLRKDTRATTETLVPGDMVWCYNPKRKKGQSPKLMSPWDGPYEVIQKMSSVTYRIRRRKSSALKVVHLNRLWKIRGPPRFSWKTKEETKGSDGKGSDECLKTNDSSLSTGPKIQATTKGLRDDQRPVKQQATFQGTKEHQVVVQPTESTVDSSPESTRRRELTRDRRPPKRYGNYICHIGWV